MKQFTIYVAMYFAAEAWEVLELFEEAAAAATAVSLLAAQCSGVFPSTSGSATLALCFSSRLT